MDTVDIIGLPVPVTYFAFLITEKLWPARDFPPRKGWQWIGVGFLLLISTIGVVTPLLIPGEWLGAHRWLDGARLGVVGGTIVGYVLLEGVVYVWHRGRTTPASCGAGSTRSITARSVSTSRARCGSTRSRWSSTSSCSFWCP